METSKPSSPESGIEVPVTVGIVWLVFPDVDRSVRDALWCEAVVRRPAGSSSGLRLSGGVQEHLKFCFVMSLESSW